MEPVTPSSLIEFFKRLGDFSPEMTSFYLLGGSALSIFGNPRKTLDIDYTTDLNPEDQQKFEKVVEQVANELQLDVEAVPLQEFIPLPPGSANRRQLIGVYGNLEVFIFDLYSIALSKIARGFESDLEDVLFMLEQSLIEKDDLEQFFKLVLPGSSKVDIDPQEYRQYFDEVIKRFKRR